MSNPIDPSTLRIRVKHPLPELSSYKAWAAYWFNYGLQVIPIVPGGKQSTVQWDPWLHDLSQEKIERHWDKHPQHEVGFVVGREMVVLDADTSEAEKALETIEAQHGHKPSFVVRTTKGCHHYFRLAEGTYAKSDSHDTLAHPHRIDVKAHRGLIVLPPSKGKEASFTYADHAEKLEAVDQDLIDAVFVHNGRPAPRQPLSAPATPRPSSAPIASTITSLEKLLSFISPNCGYEDWAHVLMALFHETQGGEDGLRLADEWSRKSTKYKGFGEIQTKWRSFRLDICNPVTIGTLIKLANEAGADIDPASFMCQQDEAFPTCETEVIEADVAELGVKTSKPKAHPLAQFSLLGHAQEVEKQTVEQKPVLGEVALLGQATVWYAAPNTGKTLIALSLLIQSIQRKVIDPAKVFYINVDDSGSGLLQKLRLADEFGFHMLAEGYRDFQAENFLGCLIELIEADEASGVIVILDTVKRFTNLMDKTMSSKFTKVIRRFVVKGGTVLGLAHTNKRVGQDGKPVYGGTSDVLDDIDCGYTLAAIAQGPDATHKVIEYCCIKRRGNVANTAAYTYSNESNLSYPQLLLSVQPCDPSHVAPLKQAAETIMDADLISMIRACIEDGVNTKMKLIEAVSERAKVSKRAACSVIERYTGNDPQVHHWSFSRRARGAQVFVLLEPTPTEPVQPTAPS